MNITAAPLSSHQLAGYSFTETIYQGTRTTVYRAIETATQQSVVIKVLSQEYPSFAELVQFRNQYTVAKNLPIAGIIRPHSLEPCGNGYALVMEDIAGIDLGQYAQQNSLALVDILSIATQLADILDELHQHRVIHKDIKPANILIHPDSKQIKLIDFSIASLLPKETQVIQSPKSLEGTLAYLAPEQTGRMNRAIDYRADFYALGITLYQLLTGKLPFTSSDPLELIHCHMTQLPIAVNQVKPGLPAMVAAIVTKLMGKNAEDRYQSTHGLKYDLERCLTQWKEQRKIASFSLGQRDVCDRFLIPEKLYGREAEVQALLEAFERAAQGAPELLLVAGFSGIGKTAVVNEIHKPIVRQRGYFIKGKFDQFNRNIPFSAFIQAFRDLVGQLLSESDAELQTWKTRILGALGENAQVLIDLIPELETILGTQPPIPELSGNAAQKRFNLLFGKFVRVFTAKEHPLVIFLDDWQWADAASFNLLNLLMIDSEIGYLMVLGAYRDNEVSPTHPLMLTLETIKQHPATIHRLSLEPLGTEHIHHLVADTLQCSMELAAPLADLIYQKTQGNPFFTTQFLQGLYEENLITFDSTVGYWQFDLTQLRQLSLTEDVIQFVGQRLQKLPAATQSILTLAACIGNQFDLETLAVACDRPQGQLAAELWPVLQNGLMIPENDIYKFFQDNDSQVEDPVSDSRAGYRFLHDHVQQAAYDLIAHDQKQQTHLNIGQLLLCNTPAHQRETRLFEIANQFNYAVDLVSDLPQRQQLAQLNFEAAHKAKLATAYSAARQYVDMALRLQSPDSWQTQYGFTRRLYELATEVACLQGDFDLMEALATDFLSNVKTALDQVKTYAIKIQAYSAQEQLATAIQTGREILIKLGVTLPENPDHDAFLQAEQLTVQKLSQYSSGDLFNFPVTDDPYAKAILEILSSITTPSFFHDPHLFGIVSLKQIDIAMAYGNTETSPFAYVCYGIVLCMTGNKTAAGYEFSQLGLNLLEKIPSPTIKVKTLMYCHLFITHWHDSLVSTLQPFLDAYQLGLTLGDLETATISAQVYCAHAYFCGLSLTTLIADMENYDRVMVQLNQEQSLGSHRIYYQAVVNLMGDCQKPWELAGHIYQPRPDLEGMYALEYDLHRLILCFLFGKNKQSLELAKRVKDNLSDAVGLLYVPLAYFYGALAQLQEAHASPEELPPSVLNSIEDSLQKLYQWSCDAPMNYLHKYQMVKAELTRLRGETAEAIELYDLAIAGAKKNGFVQEEALANELAANFYLNWGKEKVAAGYMQEAYYCYSRWGAKAKVVDLEARYPELLRPILQSLASSKNSLNTFMTSATSTTLTHTDTHHSSNGLNLNQTIDFSSILKASQALSSTIQLDELLRQLTQIILQNSGGDRCALILPDEHKKWQVRAIAMAEDTQLHADPLDNNLNLPVKLIQYVKNTQETIIINDLETDLPVIDDYLREHKPKSILCFPLLNQGKLIGILYLNNYLTRDVFNQDRIQVLNFLCSQAAISLENARLYQQAQHYAQQLEQSQLQIVQNEKMATLGNLVAGVAHEVNNPIGFLNGSIGNAKDYVQDLFKYIEMYQQQQPPTTVLQDLAEDLDLEFVLEDLPKLLGSMKDATDRIKGISTSLRTFSRADTEYKVSANLHDGLNSTLLILKYRLKANEQRPAIAVIKNYGELPEITCFPGQLNQVFMNILANAIDMFDEMAQSMPLKDLKNHPQQITIATAHLADQDAIEVRISDNGWGMPDEVKSRIFDHSFTTKAVGKGTGLGLAIAHQIIVDTHGGSLQVISAVGQGTEFCIRLPL